MAMSMDSQNRTQKLEQLEHIARTYTRHMREPHFPGHQDEAAVLLQQLDSVIKDLDRIEMCEQPVGHMHKWQESASHM